MDVCTVPRWDCGGTSVWRWWWWCN